MNNVSLKYHWPKPFLKWFFTKLRTHSVAFIAHRYLFSFLCKRQYWALSFSEKGIESLRMFLDLLQQKRAPLYLWRAGACVGTVEHELDLPMSCTPRYFVVPRLMITTKTLVYSTSDWQVPWCFLFSRPQYSFLSVRFEMIPDSCSRSMKNVTSLVWIEFYIRDSLDYFIKSRYQLFLRRWVYFLNVMWNGELFCIQAKQWVLY